MTIPIWQRLLGALVYLIPFSDAIPFGTNLFVEFPFLQIIALPALPFLLVERSLPFGGLIIFLALFLGVARNSNVSYFLRFNTLQAIIIDISLVIASYAFQVLLSTLRSSLFVRTLSSSILIATVALVIFTTIECLKGSEPDLPGVTQAVRLQLF